MAEDEDVLDALVVVGSVELFRDPVERNEARHRGSVAADVGVGVDDEEEVGSVAEGERQHALVALDVIGVRRRHRRSVRARDEVRHLGAEDFPRRRIRYLDRGGPWGAAGRRRRPRRGADLHQQLVVAGDRDQGNVAGGERRRRVERLPPLQLARQILDSGLEILDQVAAEEDVARQWIQGLRVDDLGEVLRQLPDVGGARAVVRELVVGDAIAPEGDEEKTTGSSRST